MKKYSFLFEEQKTIPAKGIILDRDNDPLSKLNNTILQNYKMLWIVSDCSEREFCGYFSKDGPRISEEGNSNSVTHIYVDSVAFHTHPSCISNFYLSVPSGQDIYSTFISKQHIETVITQFGVWQFKILKNAEIEPAKAWNLFRVYYDIIFIEYINQWGDFSKYKNKNYDLLKILQLYVNKVENININNILYFLKKKPELFVQKVLAYLSSKTITIQDLSQYGKESMKYIHGKQFIKLGFQQYYVDEKNPILKQYADYISKNIKLKKKPTTAQETRKALSQLENNEITTII